MPRIPQFKADAVIKTPSISPAAVAAPYTALAEAGKDIASTGRYMFKVGAEIEQKEKDAERAVKALHIENGLKNDMDEAAEGYYNRIDWDKFEDDAGNRLKDIRSKYQPLIQDDRVLTLAFERVFANQSAILMKTVRDKKRQVITEQGLGEHKIMFNQALKSYASAMAPEERDLIRTQTGMKTWQLVDSHIMTPKQAEESIQSFADLAEDVRADQYIEADPESALKVLKSGGFDQLSPKIKQDKIEKAQKKIEHIETEQRINEQRKEAAFEKLRKKVIDANDMKMWQDYFSGNLDMAKLESLASNQMISESVYKGIKEKERKGEPEQNNAIVVGDIASFVELRNFPKAIELLNNALQTGDIKTESYINLKKAIADKSYGDAIGYINKAMQPSELEIDFFKRQKHADAVADLATRAAAGEDPMEAAKDIVNLNRTSQSTSISRYRNPRYLIGKKDDLAALGVAKAGTLSAFNAGQITAPEYNAEMELIDKIEKAIADREKTAETAKELENVTKKLKIGK